MEKVKVLWASRHAMTEFQKDDLIDVINDCGYACGKNTNSPEIITENIVWSASEDTSRDFSENQEKWERIKAKNYDVIAGVFPPVAIECFENVSVPIFSPVSKQDRKIREDGSVQIEFIHLRYAKIN